MATPPQTNTVVVVVLAFSDIFRVRVCVSMSLEVHRQCIEIDCFETEANKQILIIAISSMA